MWEAVMQTALALTERGLVPDALVRSGIRRLAETRLSGEAQHAERADPHRSLRAEMRASAVAPASASANAQHYEVPPEFYGLVLGRARKYSCAYFPPGVTSLDHAEEAMLELTLERAQVEDGQRVLDLGCGWGAFTLFAARRLPAARFVAVSGSTSQRHHIEREARARGLANVEVITRDMNEFKPAEGSFDRVVSVEMFEHMRNWAALLARLRGALAPRGKLFIHVFSHKAFAYPFEIHGADDWMARHFFSGGLMPSHDLLPLVSHEVGLELESAHRVPGQHYQRTAELWLANLDRHAERATEILGGGREGALAVRRWRMFFLACAEIFGFRAGSEWGVSHYLLGRGEV